MVYLKLFWCFMQIGLFAIGGGYATLPLIQDQIVDNYHWLTQAELSDVITISQMTPGPIAINAASFVGMRLASWPGAIVASLACILPSFIILLCLSYFYYRYRQLDQVQAVLSGLKPAVVALIAGAGIQLLDQALSISLWQLEFAGISWLAVGILAVCLLLARRLKLDPVLVILSGGFLSLAYYFLA